MTESATHKALATSSWLANRRIQVKLGLAFGLVLGLLALSSLGFFLTERNLAVARDAVSQTLRGVAAIERMFAETLNQETALRGYLLTGEEDYLAPYDLGWAGFLEAQDEARRLTLSTEGQHGRLDRVLRILRQWREEVADPAISFRRKLGSAIESVNVEAVEAGRVKTDELRALFREMQRTEEETLTAQTARLETLLFRSQWQTLLIFVAGVLLVLLTLGLASRHVTRPIIHLTELMRRLSRGDTAITVPQLERRDEIGAIARGLEAFRQAKAAADSESWVKAHLADLNGAMQSVDHATTFAQVLLRRLCPLIGASYGAAFFYDDQKGQLVWTAGYGDVDRARLPAVFRLGQGPVGQCAQQRMPMTLTTPADYVRIASGLGDAAPRQLQLQPLLGVSGLLGVVELASFEPLADAPSKLLDQSMQMAGLILEALLRTHRATELLTQSQAQAEELQATGEALRAQQEELRATNDALQDRNRQMEVQQQKLRDSEAELRAQSEELRVANEELAEKSRVLDEFNRQLQGAQSELEQKAQALGRASRYKSEFLANMSHELRTPLNSLLILSKSFADNEDGNLTSEQVESARIIHDSGNNLLRLINDILDLSKVEAGKVQLIEESVFLKDFVDVIERNFRPVARDRQLSFKTEQQPGLPDAIVSDSARLQQVLTNLLGNSFKFTERGGVTLTLRRPAAGETLPAGLTAGDTVVFEVRDTGIGIPTDKLGKIFSVFEQVDASTSRKYGGTGLGLSISRGLAQLLGGDITVRSGVEQGSTFCLYLREVPAQRGLTAPPESVATALAPPVPSPVPAPKSETPPEKTILVIEDDDHFAKVLSDTARRRGFRALVAGDGETGLALAERERPTGILLDLGLPGIDGWEVMRRLKQNADLRHVPVHILSALDAPLRGRELGAAGFLTKPVSRANIERALDRLLHFTAGEIRHVLLVEDDPVARHDVRKLIASDEVQVVEATTGAEALRLVAHQAFDCVILDLTLPDMSGFDFLDRASGQGVLPPVVINTAGELTPEQNLRLRAYTDSIVVKGVRSRQRLLDEVTLFLHSIPRPGAGAAAEADDKELAGKTVLIVDDDMRNIFALSKTLRNRGMNVLMAQDGKKALSQLDQNGNRVDIVLMDIMMPGMDGYETTREIRKNIKLASLPVIGVTAKAMRGDREKCLEAGANDYLSKPIDVDKLLSMMRVWVCRA